MRDDCFVPPNRISMVVPATQHKLIKISESNRRKLLRYGVFCSFAACASNVVTSSTNNWLYTSEVLKYYVFPNGSDCSFDDPLINQPVYFKNATLGPWFFCWLDPVTEFHCNKLDYFSVEEPSDVTTSVEKSVRRAFIFIVIGLILDICGVFSILYSNMHNTPYRSLFVTSLLHIFAGMANFLCIIIYMSAVSKEVGNKIYPATEMDDPLFHYSYGFSFILLKVSFLCTETAALFIVIVYMAKRDEETYNRYKIRALVQSLYAASNEIANPLSNGTVITTRRKSKEISRTDEKLAIAIDFSR
ncbi:hypothetical protein L596_003722 [Steinernema carpocapsae]|uniref:Uncharacterized protein n=1 Tax=Steinernema carpocapsae TaxID=34508 RepID=A0A4U8UTL0_STECR|nr:hypothetical protein L596_003722 [Steinernema carpocapsae]